MIGLPDKKVILVPHRDEWAQESQRVISQLKEILGEDVVDAQPMGSTAIRGILAKPLIDIALGVRSLSVIKAKLEYLEANGFLFRPLTETDRHLLFAIRDPIIQIDTHYIHTVVYDSIEWREYLYFRDTLNRDESLKREYEQLKVKLAEVFSEDRTSYTQGKSKFIRRVLDTMDSK